MLEIQPGSRVRLHLRITLPNGTVAEDTFKGEPLEFCMNDGTLVRGLELGLYGLKAGDRQTLTLEPEQTFGLHDPTNVHALPRSRFPDDMSLQPGLIIAFDSGAGDEIPGAVTAIEDEQVTVDFNHPLAGKVIRFEVRILDVGPPPESE